MSFWLPTTLLNILSHFSFCKVAEKKRMNRVHISMMFRQMTEAHWSFSGTSDELFAYNIATGMVRGSPAEGIALIKRQKVADSLVVPELTPTLDVNWLENVTGKTILDK